MPFFQANPEGGLAGWGPPPHLEAGNISGIISTLVGERLKRQQQLQQAMEGIGQAMQQRKYDQIANAAADQLATARIAAERNKTLGEAMFNTAGLTRGDLNLPGQTFGMIEDPVTHQLRNANTKAGEVPTHIKIAPSWNAPGKVVPAQAFNYF